MAFWDGLLGGSGGSGDPLDIYGDLFSKEQKAALAQRQSGEGLLKLAGAFGQAAQPSRLPTSFLGALGQAAGALSGSGDEASKTALLGMKTAEDVRASRVKRAGQERYRQIVEAALRAGGIDPASPQGQRAVDQALATPPGAPPSPDAPPGAPQPPGTPPDLANIAGPASWAPPGPAPGGGIPGVDAPYGAPPPPGQQNTGLLPPPDQVLGPDGQPLQGPGVLPTMAAGYGGAPGGTPPFRLASSTPTAAATSGADDWQRVKPLIRKYESGGRNIEQGIVPPGGGYNPSVGQVTGPSSASGYYQMIDPTWRAAARKVGIDTDKYPRAIDAPEELQDKAAEALYRDQGLKPWAPYNKALAAATGYQGGGQDYVIPSGRGVPRSALQNVADTGGGAAGAGQVIPGLNLTPQQLGLLNALGKLNDIDSPFDSLLDTYYKSPGYLESAAAAGERGKDPYVRGQATHSSNLALGRSMIEKGIVLNPDGSLGIRPGAAEALSAADNAKLTGDIKEYNFYAAQEKASGGIPKPFETWDRERRQSSAAKTSINTVEGLGDAQTKARIEIDKTVALDAAKKASLANDSLPLVDEMIRLAPQTPGGWLGPVAAATAKGFAALNIPVWEGMSNAEAMNALQQRMVPALREPGTSTDQDLTRYLAATPGLANSVGGRLKMAGMMRAIAQRNIEMADVYHETIGLPTAERRAKISALNNKPLFTEEQRAAMDEAVRQGQTTAPVVPPPPPRGSTPLPGGGAEAPIPPAGPPRELRWNPATNRAE